jgi:hypothetical protein
MEIKFGNRTIGLKYPDAFQNTHLGGIGRQNAP